MKTDYICIACPFGCKLVLDDGHPDAVVVSGNKCPKGKQYAIEEHSDPKRVVTATVATDSSTTPRIPVKTTKPIQIRLIDSLLQRLGAIQIRLPAKRGDIVLVDFQQTGVDVIISRTLND